MQKAEKRKRVRNRALLRDMRRLVCEVCGAKAYGGVHHIITQGAGGPDHRYNVIQLCFDCHINKAHGGHYSKDFLFEHVARRERVSKDEVIELVWDLKA